MKNKRKVSKLLRSCRNKTIKTKKRYHQRRRKNKLMNRSNRTLIKMELMKMKRSPILQSMKMNFLNLRSSIRSGAYSGKMQHSKNDR